MKRQLAGQVALVIRGRGGLAVTQGGAAVAVTARTASELDARWV